MCLQNVYPLIYNLQTRSCLFGSFSRSLLRTFPHSNAAPANEHLKNKNLAYNTIDSVKCPGILWNRMKYSQFWLSCPIFTVSIDGDKQNNLVTRATPSIHRGSMNDQVILFISINRVFQRSRYQLLEASGSVSTCFKRCWQMQQDVSSLNFSIATRLSVPSGIWVGIPSGVSSLDTRYAMFAFMWSSQHVGWA